MPLSVVAASDRPAACVQAQIRFDPMPIELLAEIETVEHASPVQDGWRGLIDFGERWTEDDAELWPPDSGQLPAGELLTYGCELTYDSTADQAVKIHIWSLDAPRDVMTHAAPFTLQDGRKPRAAGQLL